MCVCTHTHTHTHTHTPTHTQNSLVNPHRGLVQQGVLTSPVSDMLLSHSQTLSSVYTKVIYSTINFGSGLKKVTCSKLYILSFSFTFLVLVPFTQYIHTATPSYQVNNYDTYYLVHSQLVSLFCPLNNIIHLCNMHKSYTCTLAHMHTHTHRSLFLLYPLQSPQEHGSQPTTCNPL